MRGNVLKEHQDLLHAADGHVEVDISEDVALVSAYFSVPQNPVKEDREAAVLLIGVHASQLWLCDDLILYTDVFNVVCGVGIACGPNCAAVVVEGEFVLQPVSKRALIERHVALEQLEIKRDVEAVVEVIGDGLVGSHCLIFVSSINANSRCVLVTRRIDALVLVIFPLKGRLPEIAVTVEDVTIVDGHHHVAGDLDHSLLHDGAAQVLNHGRVRIFTIQRDFEG